MDEPEEMDRILGGPEGKVHVPSVIVLIAQNLQAMQAMNHKILLSLATGPQDQHTATLLQLLASQEMTTAATLIALHCAYKAETDGRNLDYDLRNPPPTED